MNKKIKIKQFFTLLMISVFTFSLLCATGCNDKNKKSCEGISCEAKSNDRNTLIGLSVPGCGGLLSSGKGWRCDTCGLWSQRIIGFTGSVAAKYDKKGNPQKTYILGVDNQYYQTEGCSKNQANSCHALVTAGGGNWIISTGKSDGELYLGCVDGSCGFGACSGLGPGTIITADAELKLFTDF